MKNPQRFQPFTIEICTEDICRFLRSQPHSSLTQIIEHLSGGFSCLADPQRLTLWTGVRESLHQMEKRGLVRCFGGMTGNKWSLVAPELGS